MPVLCHQSSIVIYLRITFAIYRGGFTEGFIPRIILQWVLCIGIVWLLSTTMLSLLNYLFLLCCKSELQQNMFEILRKEQLGLMKEFYFPFSDWTVSFAIHVTYQRNWSELYTLYNHLFSCKGNSRINYQHILESKKAKKTFCNFKT